MLAYVFWHAPAAGADVAGYEGALGDFHEVLGDHPPEGFSRSITLRVEGAPWLPGGAGYEDWYLVEGFGDLGTLNQAAVAGRRRAPHDVVAGRSGHGAGGVYAHWAGAPEVGAGTATWFTKAPGTSYEDLRSALPAAAPATTWQRQLVLGPAPEFRLLGGAPPPGAVVVATTTSAPVWPSPPATPVGP